MNRTFSLDIKNIIINITSFLTILIGLESILIGYNFQLELFKDINCYYGLINIKMLQLHRTLAIIIGFSLIFISYRLFKRMRMAWLISICMVSILTLMYIFRSGNIFNPTTIFQLVVLIILASSRENFKKASDPISLRNGLMLSLAVVLIIIINIGFTICILKIKTTAMKGLFYATFSALKMLFLIDTSILGNVTNVQMVIAKSVIAVNWLGIIAVLIFILKPIVYQPIVTGLDRERVRKLLKKYGFNPVSYVSIVNDKKYYFGKDVEGVIAYTVSAGVAVCVGDPVCADIDLPMFITEFMVYCRQNDLDICLCHTQEKNIPLYDQFGFGNTKCGEEAMFNLETYNLTGGKAAKIRNAINHAAALGIRVAEYEPLKRRDKRKDQQFYGISKEWLNNKKSGELSFMLGTVSLENPMDRRYFAAYDTEDNMLGFIVFSPFAGGLGYYADVTRRKNDAPIGVMEKITIEAFSKMKSEGVKWGSLGLAPLVNVTQDGKVTGKLLEFVYEKLNNFYGFKSLYHYKKKYGCTAWESRYLVYYPRIFSPKIAYSIIKAHNPKGIGDFILIQLKSIFVSK